MAFGSFDQKNNSNHMVSEINMVPLIDVMLVLLVIFIITAPLLAHSIKIDIPQVSSTPVTEDPKSIDLAIDANGGIFWNESPIAEGDLREMFVSHGKEVPQPEIRIRADANTRYEQLARIMAMAKGSGLKKLGFITAPGSQNQADTGAPAQADPAPAPASVSGQAPAL
ncbi:biopolymer transporter ExbD [Advenella sp. WQ 585]|uniref:Biopolymer transporter ExbD n=1 Tax=Advenella mandrilli TaxID=2800330 RepID=A0ABS1EGJ9_9BURK|nr:biopolymer transporter ExbD [Advenella mandrilli]MBK1782149.1 biopolymer transporter ExbD [Advenella mandrilli]